MARYQPRRWLIEPAQFGRVPDAEIRPASDDPFQEGQRQVAVIQHRFACHMRTRLGIDDQGHGDRELLDRLYETPDHIYRKLRGETRMHLDQMYTWATIAGIPTRILNIEEPQPDRHEPEPVVKPRRSPTRRRTEPTTPTLFDLD